MKHDKIILLIEVFGSYRKRKPEQLEGDINSRLGFPVSLDTYWRARFDQPLAKVESRATILNQSKEKRIRAKRKREAG